jgi:hypothetical protein
MRRHHPRLRLALALSGACACSTPAPAVPQAAPAGQPGLQETEQQFQELLQRASQIAGEQQRRLDPLPEGQVRPLRAVVMEAAGRCQWRQQAQDAWREAAVDDLLEGGAEIRTALGATMALRIGQNASLLIGQSSRVLLPQVAQEGAALRTTVQLTRGRADFKVDRVGLTNDFSIVTPSTTLAVRGSAVRVQYGGLRGTETFASPTNELDAIEVRYFLTKLTAYLSGGAVTRDQVQDPVLAALFESLGPPGVVSAFLQALLEKSPALAPDELLSRLLNVNYQEFVTTLDPGGVFACPTIENGVQGLQAMRVQISPCTLCEQLFTISNAWAGALIENGIADPTDPATIDGFNQTVMKLATFCPPDLFGFQGFFQEIDRFCHAHTTNPQLCNDLFKQVAGLTSDPSPGSPQ